MELGHVHAQGLQPHPLDPALGQALGDVPAGRQYEIEAGVESGPSLLCGHGRPFAEVQGGQGRRIGVAEADAGGAGLQGGVQGRVAGHIGIAGLDKVGRQIRQGPRPLAEVGGAAIAVPEGQARGGEGHDPAGSAVMSRARHDQGVAQAGAALDPLALGRQVSFHPAAAGREQHGGVDEVDRA